jgi:hypothetical protein
MKILNRNDKIDLPWLINWLKSNLKINNFSVELFNEQGRVSYTYLVKTDLNFYVVKIKFGDKSYQAEKYFFDNLKLTHLVPEVIAESYDQKKSVAIILFTYLSGVPLFKIDLNNVKNTNLYKELSYFLDKAHNIPIQYSNYGYGTYVENTLVYINWRDFLEKTHYCKRAMAYLLKKKIFTLDTFLIIDFSINYACSFKFIPCIVHGDLSLEHIFINSDMHLQGVIDADNSFMGPKEYDFAYLLIYTDINFIESLMNNYSNDLNIKNILSLSVLIGVSKIYRMYSLKTEYRQNFFIDRVNNISRLLKIKNA